MGPQQQYPATGTPEIVRLPTTCTAVQQATQHPKQQRPFAVHSRAARRDGVRGGPQDGRLPRRQRGQPRITGGAQHLATGHTSSSTSSRGATGGPQNTVSRATRHRARTRVRGSWATARIALWCRQPAHARWGQATHANAHIRQRRAKRQLALCACTHRSARGQDTWCACSHPPLAQARKLRLHTITPHILPLTPWKQANFTIPHSLTPHTIPHCT